LVRAKMSDRNRQIQESLRLFLGKRSTYDAFELLDESIWRRFGHLDGPRHLGRSALGHPGLEAAREPSKPRTLLLHLNLG
jgi:hypothetical protein